MDREQFIKQQNAAADDKLAWTSGEDDARERFLRLAMDTYDYLVSTGIDYIQAFDPSPESTGNPLIGSWWGKRGTDFRVDLSPALIERWKDWNREYFEVRARNPRLELRDVMQDISESNDASSWPAGSERRIWDWVEASDPSAPPPFDDRRGIVAPEFFHRLRELRRLCGGWLYWNNDLKDVVFAPEPEWLRVRADQERGEAEFQRRWKETWGALEHTRQRLSEVLEAAREDAVFWEALKRWELAREGKRPPVSPAPPPDRRSLSGPVRISVGRELSPEKRAMLDNPPVDPIFADLIARVRGSDDTVKTIMIVAELRAAVRRELGLDGDLNWTGGPSVGAA